MALALDRKAFVYDPVRGPGRYRRHHAAGAGRVVGDAEGDAGDRFPGYGPDINANREEARKLMQKAGYGPDKRLAGQGLDAQHSDLPRSRRDPDRPAQEHLYRRRARRRRDRQWFPKVARKDYSARPQPDRQRASTIPTSRSTRTIPAARSATTPTTATRRSRSCSTSSRWRPTSPSARSWSGRSTRSCRRTWRARSSSTPRSGTCWQPYVKGITIMVNSSYNGYRYEDVWLDK